MKTPLRSNKIISSLTSDAVVYGTDAPAAGAILTALNSPTPIGGDFWCWDGSEWIRLSVIDLGENEYLGLVMNQQLGYIMAYEGNGEVIGTGGGKLNGPVFSFLSSEDCNDTAVQLGNPIGGNGGVNDYEGLQRCILAWWEIGSDIVEEGSTQKPYPADATFRFENAPYEDVADLFLSFEAYAIPALLGADGSGDVFPNDVAYDPIISIIVNLVSVPSIQQSSDNSWGAEPSLVTFSLSLEEDSETGDSRIYVTDAYNGTYVTGTITIKAVQTEGE